MLLLLLLGMLRCSYAQYLVAGVIHLDGCWQYAVETVAAMRRAGLPEIVHSVGAAGDQRFFPAPAPCLEQRPLRLGVGMVQPATEIGFLIYFSSCHHV